MTIEHLLMVLMISERLGIQGILVNPIRSHMLHRNRQSSHVLALLKTKLMICTDTPSSMVKSVIFTRIMELYTATVLSMVLLTGLLMKKLILIMVMVNMLPKPLMKILKIVQNRQMKYLNFVLPIQKNALPVSHVHHPVTTSIVYVIKQRRLVVWHSLGF